jgi:hypothetical protein
LAPFARAGSETRAGHFQSTVDGDGPIGIQSRALGHKVEKPSPILWNFSGIDHTVAISIETSEETLKPTATIGISTSGW